jgi:ATP-dependent 26S proteasome regulatory subunit
MDYTPGEELGRDNLPIDQDFSLKHLQAELARIDLMIQRQVQLWHAAGQDQTDAFRGLYVSDEQAWALLARPMCFNWGDTATLDSDELNTFKKAIQRARRQAQAFSSAARCQDRPTRLERLTDIFGLNQFEADTLLICLAPALDLRYEKLYGYLQDDITRKRPGVNLILDMLCEPGLARLLALDYFSEDSPLIKHSLLEKIPEPGPVRPSRLGQLLCVDETVSAWLLLRKYHPGPEFSGRVFLSWPAADPETELLSPVTPAQLQQIVKSDPILIFHGPDRAGQESAARLVAASRKQPLLSMDLRTLLDEGIQPRRILQLALRDACLTGAIPFLSNCEVFLEDAALPDELMADLCDFPGLVILSSQTAWQAQRSGRERGLRWVEFPLPDFVGRRSLWAHFLHQSTADHDVNVDEVSGHFYLSRAQIREAAKTARDFAAQEERPIREADLFSAARTHSSSRISSLARKITPRYGWKDIVLPSDQRTILEEIVATVRNRPLVLDKWGVGQKLVPSRGITVLFAGPPGTGKTMAAEIVASELGLDLYKIDLSSIISKYIGETEKNLENIFHAAESSNAILFFDEADALFGKRSEVRDSHDRYANIEISYLLQRMETYGGVSILATNLRANLDEAFTRRLQFTIDFPFPDEEDRLRIWRALIPPDLPRSSALNFEFLAKRFKIAGGGIRNIIISAAFLAASDGQGVTMEHLLHGARRELQKMGRLLIEEESFQA